jgi:hypothetical protein
VTSDLSETPMRGANDIDRFEIDRIGHGFWCFPDELRAHSDGRARYLICDAVSIKPDYFVMDGLR